MSTFRRIWGVPAILAGATLLALIGALVAEGVWDILASLTLLCAMAYAVGQGLRRWEP